MATNKKTYCARTHRGTIGIDLHKCTGGTTCKGDCKPKQEECSECGGSGQLTRLGGDWGKTPDTIVTCWNCHGTGKV